MERKLFTIPSFKIYGGVAGFFDFGPPGCAVKQNITQLWRQHFILEENMLEVWHFRLIDTPYVDMPVAASCTCTAHVQYTPHTPYLDMPVAASCTCTAHVQYTPHLPSSYRDMLPHMSFRWPVHASQSLALPLLWHSCIRETESATQPAKNLDFW